MKHSGPLQLFLLWRGCSHSGKQETLSLYLTLYIKWIIIGAFSTISFVEGIIIIIIVSIGSFY